MTQSLAEPGHPQRNVETGGRHIGKIRWTTRPGYTGAAALSGSPAARKPGGGDAAPGNGEARYSWPGPERPGKLRLIAEMVTSVGLRETPGPALMQAPQLGSMKVAPTSAKMRS